MHGKVNTHIKQVFFLLLVIICFPPEIQNGRLFATNADTMIDIVYEVDLNIIQALGLVVSDKKIFKVFILKIFF